MKIKILAEGGSMAPGPALSQKLGPAGINISQVISKVNDATRDFKGLKVPVELDVNISKRTFDIHVFSPPVSELLKKELGITKGSGLQKKEYSGNASIEQIISVAKIKMPGMLSRDLRSSVKNVVGTCVSLGLLIESKPAKEIEKEINDGKYDKEINSGKTETSPEKKAQLEQYFSEIKTQQEKIKKVEEAAKEAAVQAATEAGTAGATATPATPATAAKVAAKPEAKKPEAKKETKKK